MNYVTILLSNGDFYEFWVSNENIDETVIAIRDSSLKEESTKACPNCGNRLDSMIDVDGCPDNFHNHN